MQTESVRRLRALVLGLPADSAMRLVEYQRTEARKNVISIADARKRFAAKGELF